MHGSGHWVWVLALQWQHLPREYIYVHGRVSLHCSPRAKTKQTTAYRKMTKYTTKIDSTNPVPVHPCMQCAGWCFRQQIANMSQRAVKTPLKRKATASMTAASPETPFVHSASVVPIRMAQTASSDPDPPPTAKNGDSTAAEQHPPLVPNCHNCSIQKQISKQFTVLASRHPIYQQRPPPTKRFVYTSHAHLAVSDIDVTSH